MKEKEPKNQKKKGGPIMTQQKKNKFEKIIISIIVIIAFIIPTILTIYNVSLEAKNQKLKIEIDDLASRESITNNEIYNDILKLEHNDRETLLKKETTDLKKSIMRLNINKTALESRISDLEHNKLTLEIQLKELKKQFNKLNEDKIQDNVDFINQKSKLETRISDLQLRIDILNSKEYLIFDEVFNEIANIINQDRINKQNNASPDIRFDEIFNEISKLENTNREESTKANTKLLNSFADRDELAITNHKLFCSLQEKDQEYKAIQQDNNLLINQVHNLESLNNRNLDNEDIIIQDEINNEILSDINNIKNK